MTEPEMQRMKTEPQIRIIPMLTVLALCITFLCGCGGFDAGGYVLGGLDALYKGEVSEKYLALVADSREDCLAMYEENMLNEARNFCKMFYVAVNSEPDESLVQLYKDIYAKSRYEVTSTTKTDEGYTVELTVYPVDIFRTSAEALDAYDSDFNQRFSDSEFAEISGSELEKEYLLGMVNVISEAVSDMGYLDPVTVTLHLTLDENGIYQTDDGEYALLHNSIIAY